MALGLFAQQQLQLRDNLFQPYPVSGVVTVIEIDDASLARYGRWDEWPRTLHADLIDRLNEGGARAIVLDFVFAAETANDGPLVESMQEAGNVIQPLLAQGDGYHDTPDAVRFEGGVWPQSDLLAVSAAVGHANVLHDIDGFVREIPAVVSIEG
jgi:CHASE2 domain-containing sensor protein